MTPPLEIESTYHWPVNGESRPWTEFWVTTLSKPVGTAVRAAMLLCVNDAPEWRHLEMSHACILGEADVWHINLGTFPAGTRIRYAVEVVSASGESVWDNCGHRDFHACIGTAQDLARVKAR